MSIVQFKEKASQMRDAYDWLASHFVAFSQGLNIAFPAVIESPMMIMCLVRGGGGGAKAPSVRSAATVIRQPTPRSKFGHELKTASVVYQRDRL